VLLGTADLGSLGAVRRCHTGTFAPSACTCPGSSRGRCTYVGQTRRERAQLTFRASLQLRGLPDRFPQELTEAVLALGVVPSVPHERVRNIVASPFPSTPSQRRRERSSATTRPEMTRSP
jgi:hypothetical protein